MENKILSATIETQEDKDGNIIICFPDEIMKSLGWKEGDVLVWKIKGEEAIITKKKIKK